MIRIFKYIFYGLIGLVALLLLLLMFTQTRPFRELVRSRAENMANEQLHGHVSIGELEGSFFSDLTLRDVKIELAPQDTLVSFDRLSLKYSLWPLLSGKIQVHSIVFDRLDVNLAQRKDSTWNFEELLPPSSPDTTDTLSSEPFGFAVELGTFQLREANVHLNMLDSLAPSYVSNIHLDVGGRYNSGEWLVELRDFGFVTPPAMPDIKQFRGSLANRDGVFSLTNFELVTPRNQLNAKGEYTGMEQFDGGVNTSPFHLDEFTWMLPDIQLGVAPEIEIDAGVEERDLTIDLSLADGDERFALQGSVLGFPALLSDSTRHQGELDLTATFHKLDPQKWFLLTDLPLIVNGNIQMKGNGLSGSQLPLKIEGDFSGSRWEGFLFRKLGFEGSYLDGDTHLSFQTATDLGRISMTGQGHINQPGSPFQIEAKAEEFPAHRFLPEWGDSTILNMELAVDGTGNDQDNLKAGFSLDLFNSLVARVPVEALIIKGEYSEGDVLLDTLSFLNASVDLKGEGSYARSGDVTGSVKAALAGLDAFSAYIEVPAAWKELDIKGSASGNMDSLMVDLLMDADSLTYDTIARVGDLHLQGDGLFAKGEFTGAGKLMGTRIDAAGQNLDSLHLDAGVAPDEWDAGLSVWMPDSVSLTTQMNGNWESPYKISIPVLDINTPSESFSVEGAGPSIYADTSRLELDGFHLGARRNGRFEIRGRGAYVTGDSIDLDFMIDHFDLSLPEKLSLISEPAEGFASVGLRAKGPLNNPDIKLNARVDSLKYSQFLASHLTVDLAYLADTLRSSLAVQNVHGDSITANMMAPVEIQLADSQMVSSFDAIDGHLQAKDVRPSAFYEFDSEKLLS
ncbi:MAG: AsmA family protein, partial [Bacteroidota bacterium]